MIRMSTLNYARKSNVYKHCVLVNKVKKLSKKGLKLSAKKFNKRNELDQNYCILDN